MEQIVLITGASSGIGKAIGKHLSSCGYKVYGSSRKPTQDKDIRFLQMDVTDPDSIKKNIEELIENEGRIDVLINSAGLGIINAMEEVPIDEVRKVFETNVFGVLQVCQTVIPFMRKQKAGNIINISSIAGEVGLPFRGIYASTKFALEGMTEAMRMELLPFGIKTSIIQPGDFNTNINQNRIVIGSKKGSPYKQFLDTVTDQIQEEMQKAPTPESIGILAEKILKSSQPQIRYRIGALLEKLTPSLKKMLPYKQYEKLIMQHYHMDGKALKRQAKKAVEK
jgi:NAD(P)-dependent dehydrogenase (short-subunit alcohol dehydrogenase family)